MHKTRVATTNAQTLQPLCMFHKYRRQKARVHTNSMCKIHKFRDIMLTNGELAATNCACSLTQFLSNCKNYVF